MTLTEALAELGLERGADADTVRRTYLNLIKIRRPETDPEGFQRARRAFEVARDAGTLDALAWANLPVPTAAPVPAPVVDPVVDPFVDFFHTWQSTPASEGFKARLEIARAAVRALPGDPRSHWLLVTSLSGFAGDTEVAAALRAGHQAGGAGFLEALLVRVPREATSDEIEHALASDRLPLRVGAAGALAIRDGTRAAAVLADACRAAAAGAPDFPLDRALEVVLSLHRSCQVAAALVAHGAVHALVADQALGLQMLRGPLGAIWTLADELSALPADFPNPLRHSFATAIGTGDLRGAFYDACFHVRQNRREVRRWIQRTATRAPNIRNILQGALAREAQGRRERQAAPSRRIWWLAAPLILGAIRILSSNIGPTTNHYATYRRNVPADESTMLPTTTSLPTDPPAGSAPPPPPAGHAIQRLDEALAALCDDMAHPPNLLRCETARAFVEAVEIGDCTRGDQLRAQLRHELGGWAPGAGEARLLSRGSLELWQLCGSAPPDGRPPR